MSLIILKRDSDLLIDITKKYMDIPNDKNSKVEKKKLEKYINSLLLNIEKEINENVAGFT